MVFRLPGLLVWILAFAAGAPTVRAGEAPSAQDLAGARQRYDRAERLYAVGKFKEALDEFTAAYEAAPLPDFLFNIGQCHRRLGHHDEAIFFFTGFLERADNVNRADIEALIAEQRAAKARDDAKKNETLAGEHAAVAAVITHSAPVERPRPMYKKWWLWTAVGVVVAGGAATVLALTLPGHSGLPSGALGTIDAR